MISFIPSHRRQGVFRCSALGVSQESRNHTLFLTHVRWVVRLFVSALLFCLNFYLEYGFPHLYSVLLMSCALPYQFTKNQSQGRGLDFCLVICHFCFFLYPYRYITLQSSVQSMSRDLLRGFKESTGEFSIRFLITTFWVEMLPLILSYKQLK